MKDRKRRATLFVMLVVILVLTMTWIGLASADVGNAEGWIDESPLPTPTPRLGDRHLEKGATPIAMLKPPGNQGRGKALGHYKSRK